MMLRRPLSLAHEVRVELRRFARDPAGARFAKHHERAERKRTLTRTVVRTALGSVFTAAGVAMWFLPGPGWLFVFFGLALFAGESRWLAQALDRAELFARRNAKPAGRAWRRAPRAVKALMIAALLALAGGATAAAAWLMLR